jgi:DNA polymerase III delta prime subunit
MADDAAAVAATPAARTELAEWELLCRAFFFDSDAAAERVIAVFDNAQAANKALTASDEEVLQRLGFCKADKKAYKLSLELQKSYSDKKNAVRRQFHAVQQMQSVKRLDELLKSYSTTGEEPYAHSIEVSCCDYKCLFANIRSSL